jgi:hypothetical protein
LYDSQSLLGVTLSAALHCHPTTIPQLLVFLECNNGIDRAAAE